MVVFISLDFVVFMEDAFSYEYLGNTPVSLGDF